MNYYFQRYQDDNSWFDFDQFYTSLKAKNRSINPQISTFKESVSSLRKGMGD